VTGERAGPATVYVGCGAGFADERPDACIPVVETLASRDGPRYLIFETLGERTLALAQLERRRDPAAGFTPGTAAFLRPILRRCREAGIRIVANFGAANSEGAGRLILALADELGLADFKVGIVEGDDLLAYVDQGEIRSWPIVEGIPVGEEPIIAANVYLGAAPVAEALRRGADVVVLGRCADSALVLGPLVHEFGWPDDDWGHLAAGTLAGHLLECSAQLSGGYFADPGYKDVPDLARVGFPIAEVAADGSMVVTKADGTGGLVSPRTVKEQILYELGDPSAYLVPDVTLDITDVEVEEVAPNRVRVTGALGKPRPPTLKVTISTEGGWLAEGEISYGGPNALARAELAARVLEERLAIVGLDVPTRIDVIGTVSTFDSARGDLREAGRFPPDGDYRVRLAGTAPDRPSAERIAGEVIGLYSTGPAGGGGVRRSVVGRVRTMSALVDRDLVDIRVRILTGDDDGR
jgi:hypothetical protein